MLNLIKTLCGLDGVSGDEEKICDFIKNEIKDHVDDMRVDNMGNLIALKKGKKTPEQKLMVCAHMDEVGFIVKHISDDGMLKFGFCGGIDPRVVIGKRVRFGDVKGVVGIKAVHLTTAAERQVSVKASAMYIDIGAKSKAEAEGKVSLGDFGTFDTEVIEFGDGMLKAKAIDDRFGCALMIKLLKTELEYDTYFSFNVQEETGLRGAMTSAFSINPDVAIIIESTTAADLADIKGAKKVCKVGDGVALSFMDRSTIYDRETFIKATELADKYGIKYQVKSLVAGGNDSGAIHKSKDGVKTVAFSLPTRYLHTGVSVGKVTDMEEIYKLLEVFVKEGIK